MRLSEKQIRFHRLLAKVIQYTEDQNIPTKVQELWRSPQKQVRLVKQGLSDTYLSKHIEGLAADLAIIRDNKYITDPEAYKLIGEYAESLGLVWGGRWKLASGATDPFHIELGGED